MHVCITDRVKQHRFNCDVICMCDVIKLYSGYQLRKNLIKYNCNFAIGVKFRRVSALPDITVIK